MSMKFLLDNLTPQAITHINPTINTSNQESYRKLKKIFNDHFIELKSFEDTNLEITSFDWNGIERDRNWWWQAHALPFLNWYLDSYDLQNEEERKKYFTLCISAIDNWNKKTKNYDSPLAWHDHGTAFRSRNIVNWIIFCHLRNIDVVTANDKINLYSLVMVHLDWLLDSNNYSKYTNHGFDQAMILLTIGIMFDTEKLEPQRAISRQRLEEEIKYAFTDEGVHIENSPGYQKFMLARLKQLRLLSPLGETVISQLAESYIEKAEDFLRAITLPNGYLPMIGDTRGEDKGLKNDNDREPEYVIYDYSKSGYFIVKGNNAEIGSFYLLFKNCHDSNYHRHDDDLMIYLWCNGEVIFGDGGLYSHNEQSKVRRFLRSHLAHSVPFTGGKIERDRNKLIEKSKLSFNSENNLIISESYGSGNKITRKVNIEDIEKGILLITDEVESLPLYVNHYFGKDAEVKLMKKNSAVINIGSVFCNMTFPFTRSVNLYKGSNTSFRESSFFSEKYGEKLENTRILISSSSTSSEISLSFGKHTH